MYTVDDTRDIFYGDHKHTGTGEHWAVEVGQGKTEMQEDEVYEAPRRVELREISTGAATVEVTLPTGNHVLADFLEANGHTEAAQAVRGFVLEWRMVDPDRP
jgi:hypothetical protein